jgi:DNA-binding transcriptional MerR regulator
MAGLSIGEVARRCGVSVRALRLYEAEGLLRPARSEAGRRVYGGDQLGRVHQILVLKRAGWTLAEIGRLLRAGPLDPARLIDVQIGLVEQRHAALERSLGALKAARATLAGGESLTVDLLCELIRTGEQTMVEDAWNEVFEKYYSAEDMERWKQAKAMTDDAAQRAYGQSWLELIGRVEAAMAAGVTPSDARAVALAQEWYALQAPMVEKVGLETWNKAATMYAEMDQWQTSAVKAPFSADVYAWVCAAVETGRAQGVVPPRR